MPVFFFWFLFFPSGGFTFQASTHLTAWHFLIFFFLLFYAAKLRAPRIEVRFFVRFASLSVPIMGFWEFYDDDSTGTSRAAQGRELGRLGVPKAGNLGITGGGFCLLPELLGLW